MIGIKVLSVARKRSFFPSTSFEAERNMDRFNLYYILFALQTFNLIYDVIIHRLKRDHQTREERIF